MAPVKKHPHDRAKHFLKEWRNFRGLSQEAAAERAEVSRSNLSKIEKGDVPYNQDLLERLADAFGCQPQDLISRDPREEPEWSIFDLPAGHKDQVREFIRALRVIGTAENSQAALDRKQPEAPFTHSPASKKRKNS